MAHAHGLTREDVFAAADEIFASGKNPTQASVRAKLSKGSFSTISKHLSDWRGMQTDTEAVLNANQELSDQELSLLKRVYGMLRANVEASVIGEQVELLEKENQRLQERLANYDVIAAELAGLRYAYQEALERLDQLTRENERLTQAAAKTSTRKPRAAKSATT